MPDGAHDHDYATTAAVETLAGQLLAASEAGDDRYAALAARVKALEDGAPIPVPEPEPVPEPTPDPAEPAGLIWCPLVPSLETDQGGALRSWILANASKGPLGLRPGSYRVDARMQMALSSLHLWAPDVVFARISESATGAIVSLKQVTDVLIEWLDIIGPTSAVPYNTTTSFARQNDHAIELIAAKRVTLRDMDLGQVLGDGVYWNRSDSLGIASTPEDIRLERVRVDTAGRNGFSHITGRRITLTDCRAWRSKLHGFDVEPNKGDDVTEDLRLTRFRSTEHDRGQTDSGPGYAVAIGPGYGKVAAHRVTIEGLSLDRTGRTGRAAVYVVGPSSSKPHTEVTLTGTRCDEPSTADIRNVSGLVYGDNDGLVRA